MMSYTEVRDATLALPLHEQYELMKSLAENLNDDSERIERAKTVELIRRIEAYERGEGEPMNLADSMAWIREQLANRKTKFSVRVSRSLRISTQGGLG